MSEATLTRGVPQGTRHVLRRVWRGGAWVVLGRSVGIGLGALVSVVLARYLSRGDFGLFQVLWSVVAYFALVGRLGVDRVLVIYIAGSLGRGDASEARGHARRCFRMAGFGTLAAALLVFLLIGLSGRTLFALDRPWIVASLCAVCLGLTSSVRVVSETLRGFHDLKWASLLDVQGGPLLNVFMAGLLVSAVILFSPSLVVALGVHAAALLVVLIFAALRMRKPSHSAADIPRPATSATRTEKPLDAHWRRLCLTLMLAQALTAVAASADLWIAGLTCPADELGLYAAARRLVLIFSLPLGMVNLSVISSIPELHSQGRLRDLQRVLQATSTLALACSLCILVPVILFPRFSLGLLFGAQYRDAASLLVVMSLGQLAATWTGSCQFTLEMTGHERLVLVLSFVAVLALAILGPLAALHYGGLGLAVVAATVVAGRNLAAWRLAKSHSGVWTHAELRPTVLHGLWREARQ